MAVCAVQGAPGPAGDDLSVAKRQLPADVQQPALFDDGHIGGDRRGGFGKVEAEIGELGGNVHDASLYQFGGGGRDIVGKPGENPVLGRGRSEEHTPELQPLMRISYAVS